MWSPWCSSIFADAKRRRLLRWRRQCQSGEGESNIYILETEYYHVYYSFFRSYIHFMQVLRRELDMVKREKKEKKEFLSNFFKDDNEDIVGGVFQLKQSLHEFLRCRIGNGRTASFCYDSWTELGPMGISWVLRNQCNFAYSGMDCYKSNTSWKLYFPPVHFLNAETTSDSYAMMCICGEVLLEISWTDSSPKWHGNGLDNLHLLFLGILRFGSSKKPQAVLLSIGQLCHLDFHLEIGCCLSVWRSWQVVFYVRTAHNLINISSSTVLSRLDYGTDSQGTS